MRASEQLAPVRAQVSTSRPAGATANPAPIHALAAAPASTPIATRLRALQQRVGASELAVAFMPVSGGTTTQWGSLDAPAWSTIKVPLSVAALTAGASPTVVRRAITVSDNAAAQALWDGLGAGTTAAAQVDAVLRTAGDTTTRTNPFVTRRSFTAFGQTRWSMAHQVRFVSWLAKQKASAPALVYSTMGQVTPSQRWGLGTLSQARFKGGWGPKPDGRYVARQFGVVTCARVPYAVAIGAVARRGGFDDATRVLSAVTQDLFARGCPR